MVGAKGSRERKRQPGERDGEWGSLGSGVGDGGDGRLGGVPLGDRKSQGRAEGWARSASRTSEPGSGQPARTLHQQLMGVGAPERVGLATSGNDTHPRTRTTGERGRGRGRGRERRATSDGQGLLQGIQRPSGAGRVPLGWGEGALAGRTAALGVPRRRRLVSEEDAHATAVTTVTTVSGGGNVGEGLGVGGVKVAAGKPQPSKMAKSQPHKPPVKIPLPMGFGMAAAQGACRSRSLSRSLALSLSRSLALSLARSLAPSLARSLALSLALSLSRALCSGGWPQLARAAAAAASSSIFDLWLTSPPLAPPRYFPLAAYVSLIGMRLECIRCG